jgi:hypothetical protein
VLISLTCVVDGWELKQLYSAYRSFAHPNEVITRKAFLRVFPELENELVIDSLFNALDKLKKRDDCISFEETIIGLSVMCRGDQRDKAERTLFCLHTTWIPIGLLGD